MICKNPDCGMPEMRDGFCQECHRAHALEEQTKRIQAILGTHKEDQEDLKSIQKRQVLEKETKPTKRVNKRKPVQPVSVAHPPLPPPPPVVVKPATPVFTPERPPKMYNEEGLCEVGPCKEAALESGFCADCDELFQDFIKNQGSLRFIKRVPSQYQLEVFRKRTAPAPTPEA